MLSTPDGSLASIYFNCPSGRKTNFTRIKKIRNVLSSHSDNGQCLPPSHDQCTAISRHVQLRAVRNLNKRIIKKIELWRLHVWTHRNEGQSRHFRHEKFEMFSTLTGSWNRSRLRRDRIQLPVGFENTSSNFSKFSCRKCRKWQDCPSIRRVQVYHSRTTV